LHDKEFPWAQAGGERSKIRPARGALAHFSSLHPDSRFHRLARDIVDLHRIARQAERNPQCGRGLPHTHPRTPTSLSPNTSAFARDCARLWSIFNSHLLRNQRFSIFCAETTSNRFRQLRVSSQNPSSASARAPCRSKAKYLNIAISCEGARSCSFQHWRPSEHFFFAQHARSWPIEKFERQVFRTSRLVLRILD